MTMDHPNIESRDWRLRAISTLAKDFCSSTGQTHPIGTVVELAGFVHLPDGSGLSIPVPDPTAIYLSLAKAAFDKATEHQNQLFPNAVLPGESGVQPRLHPELDGSLFDCFQSLIAGVVFSYTALEAFANSVIPDGYSFSVERGDKKCVETYSRDQIERHISLDVKLDKILPEICSVPTLKGTQKWEQYVKLKKVRDRLIHLKSTDWQKSTPEKAEEYVWTWLLANETHQMASYSFEIIWHYLPSEKPRWAQRFRGDMNLLSAS